MEFSKNLLFFFSALGAFNGLFLSLYFAFFINNRNRTTYFLSALIFVISVRVVKSVFISFYPGTSSLFVQVGLTACCLIGPFLYIYVQEVKNPSSRRNWFWLFHVVPVIIAMIFIGYFYPYREYNYLWWRLPPRILGVLLFVQWTVYIMLAAIIAKDSFRRLVRSKEKLTTEDFWILNVVIGVALIWLAYNTSQYTSYIVGALSFSFTLYLSLLIWVFKRRKSARFFAQPNMKYAKKRVSNTEAANIEIKLRDLFIENKVYENPQLKLKDVATLIDETPHTLSEYLNDNLGKSFSLFVNEYRVETASQMLVNNDHLTIEAIGNECGFKSNSTFYAAFKKYKGMTPSQFKKAGK